MRVVFIVSAKKRWLPFFYYDGLQVTWVVIGPSGSGGRGLQKKKMVDDRESFMMATTTSFPPKELC